MKTQMIFFAFSVSVLGACTTIRIEEADGNTRIEPNFGFASVRLGPTADAVVAEIHSFGYVGSPLGIGVGYSRQTIAALSPTCRVVIWLEGQEDLEAIRMALRGEEGVCPIVKHKGHDDENK